jgi:hypothetical protein
MNEILPGREESNPEEKSNPREERNPAALLLS